MVFGGELGHFVIFIVDDQLTGVSNRDYGVGVAALGSTEVVVGGGGG